MSQVPAEVAESQLWFKKYEDCKNLSAGIFEVLEKRDKNLTDGSVDISSLTMLARKDLVTLGSQIDTLRDTLNSKDLFKVTELEKNKRREMISEIKSQKDKLQIRLRSEKNTALGASVSREANAPSTLNDRELLQYQRERLQYQDRELIELEKSVCRTQDIAVNINNELNLQESLLGDLEEGVDVSRDRLHAVDRKLKLLMKQAGYCKLTLMLACVIIIAFVILNVVIKLFKILL